MVQRHTGDMVFECIKRLQMEYMCDGGVRGSGLQQASTGCTLFYRSLKMHCSRPRLEIYLLLSTGTHHDVSLGRQSCASSDAMPNMFQ